jgi:hypothetical protein
VFLAPPGGRPRISEVGTDLRAVRPRGIACRECLPRGVALHCPVRRSGAFGKIALSRRCMGKAEFAEGPRLYSPMTSEVLGLGGVCGRTSGMSPNNLRGAWVSWVCGRTPGMSPNNLRGAWVSWFFGRTPGCSRMTSEVGTDLRAVRPRGIACRECLPGRFA